MKKGKIDLVRIEVEFSVIHFDVSSVFESMAHESFEQQIDVKLAKFL